MKNKTGIYKKEDLDRMLAASFLFLDPKNAGTEEMANIVANEVLASKSAFLKLKEIFTFKRLVFVMILTVIGLISIFSDKNFVTKKFEKMKTRLPIQSPISISPFSPASEKPETKIHPVSNIRDTVAGSFIETNIKVSEVKNESMIPNLNSLPFADSAYQFPVLTEEEIKANHFNKKKMIHQLSKFSKAKYALVSMGTCEYKGKKVSVNEFYMQKTEVSNLEYRTFLFDLLISGKKEDFLKAKPDQRKWVTAFEWNFNEPMAKMYFSHPAYDDYPVVNVSAEGAEMYCKWLTIETNKLLMNNNKPLINDLRIPHEYEWAMAASSKRNKAKYANGMDTLLLKNQYTVNYGGITKNETRYFAERDIYYPKSAEFQKKDETALIRMTKDGALQTFVVSSFPSNDYGIHNLAGNVAEFVKTSNDSTHTTFSYSVKGGSWFSSDYFLQLDAEDEFKRPAEPSPLKGFRVVTTNTGKRRRIPF